MQSGRPEYAEGLRLMVGTLSHLVQALGEAGSDATARAMLLSLNVQAGALQDEVVRRLVLLSEGRDDAGGTGSASTGAGS